MGGLKLWQTEKRSIQTETDDRRKKGCHPRSAPGV